MHVVVPGFFRVESKTVVNYSDWCLKNRGFQRLSLLVVPMTWVSLITSREHQVSMSFLIKHLKNEPVSSISSGRMLGYCCRPSTSHP